MQCVIPWQVQCFGSSWWYLRWLMVGDKGCNSECVGISLLMMVLLLLDDTAALLVDHLTVTFEQCTFVFAQIVDLSLHVFHHHHVYQLFLLCLLLIYYFFCSLYYSPFLGARTITWTHWVSAKTMANASSTRRTERRAKAADWRSVLWSECPKAVSLSLFCYLSVFVKPVSTLNTAGTSSQLEKLKSGDFEAS